MRGERGLGCGGEVDNHAFAGEWRAELGLVRLSGVVRWDRLDAIWQGDLRALEREELVCDGVDTDGRFPGVGRCCGS